MTDVAYLRHNCGSTEHGSRRSAAHKADLSRTTALPGCCRDRSQHSALGRQSGQ